MKDAVIDLCALSKAKEVLIGVHFHTLHASHLSGIKEIVVKKTL